MAIQRSQDGDAYRVDLESFQIGMFRKELVESSRSVDSTLVVAGAV